MNIRPFIEPWCKSWDEFNAYARELGRRAGKRHVLAPKDDEQCDHDWNLYVDEPWVRDE